MAKTEPKTMRFDLDVYEYICGFGDGNFTDNFHEMVKRYRDEEQALNRRHDMIRVKIKDAEKRLDDLNQMLFDCRHIENKFRSLNDAIQGAQGYLEHFLQIDIQKKDGPKTWAAPVRM